MVKIFELKNKETNEIILVSKEDFEKVKNKEECYLDYEIWEAWRIIDSTRICSQIEKEKLQVKKPVNRLEQGLLKEANPRLYKETAKKKKVIQKGKKLSKEIEELIKEV